MIKRIEETINPPGIANKNRLALFSTIGGIADTVRADALKAFNARFPYLADGAKLEEHGLYPKHGVLREAQNSRSKSAKRIYDRACWTAPKKNTATVFQRPRSF
jgi:hypothetical protein